MLTADSPPPTLRGIDATASPVPPLQRRAWELPLVCLLLAALTVLLHRGALMGEWAYDDLRILRHALEFRPWQHFVDRQSWQIFSVANLTPLQILSYQLDLGMFGLSRPAFAVHQLMALWAAAVATWLLLRAWLTGAWPFLGAVLLLCSPPAAVVATNLWNRQYVEGLVLCTLALLAAVRAVRSGSRAWAWFGALLYLGACAAKEVFVPALLVLAVLPVGTWRARARTLWPFALAAVLYVPWRLYMLGGTVGGYEMVRPTVMDQVRLYRLPALLFGHDLAGKAARVAVLALILGWLALAPRRIPLVLVALLAMLVPLLPIASTVGEADRYLLVPAWLMALLAPRAASALAARWPRAHLSGVLVLALLALVLTGAQARLLARQEDGRRDPGLAAAARFLAHAPAERALFLTSPLADEQFPYLYEWRWIVQRFRPGGIPALLVDECELVDRAGPIWCWAPDRGELVEATSHVPGLLEAWRARARTRPLSLELSVSGTDGVALHFGPAREGMYTLVAGSGFGRALRFAPGREHTTVVENGITGRLPLFEMRSHVRDTFFGMVTFRVRHEAPDGTVSYSPELTFDRAHADHFAWAR